MRIMITKGFLLKGGVASLALAAGLSQRMKPAMARSFAVVHSDDEWRKLLTPNQFAVLRQSVTERPYTSPLLKEHRRGNFDCAGCDLALFSSTTKFESGTGWPSFWAPLDHAVGTEQDNSLGMAR